MGGVAGRRQEEAEQIQVALGAPIRLLHVQRGCGGTRSQGSSQPQTLMQRGRWLRTNQQTGRGETVLGSREENSLKDKGGAGLARLLTFFFGARSW